MLSICQLFENNQKSNFDYLVDLKNYPFILDYSEVKMFSSQPTIELNKKAADSLLSAQKNIRDYKFIITWGYRGYKEQYHIFHFMKAKLKKSYPNNWEEKLDIYTGGQSFLDYIKNTPKSKQSCMSHASGNAVDITGIINNKNQQLNLGGQKNNERDAIDYYKSGQIYNNRKLLMESLISIGFRNHPKEWWHWGYCQ